MTELLHGVFTDAFVSRTYDASMALTVISPGVLATLMFQLGVRAGFRNPIMRAKVGVSWPLASAVHNNDRQLVFVGMSPAPGFPRLTVSS